MVRALSTAACPYPAEVRPLLQAWRARAGDRVSTMALDARLHPGLQEALLAAGRVEGVTCVELAHSRFGPSGLRAASPISEDKDELQAAREQLGRSVRVAQDHGVPRVLLLGQRLELTVSRAELASRFARGRALGLEELAPPRAALGLPALDHLSLVLDSALALAAERGITLLLPSPAPWPDQVPSLVETARLLELFEGAPLATCYGTDWAQVSASLVGEDPVPAAAVPRVGALRVADACGLTQRLAPGTGEVRFDRLLASTRELDQVLTPGPEVRPEEIGRAVDLLESLPGQA